jgi:lipopolysaccharide assembly outer membrane protein LptD (OstA)
MALNGDIVIRSQGVLIQSQKAIIDLDSMEADFIGYTEILRDGDEAPAQAERFTINFETGEMRMLDAFIPSIDLKSQKENEESPKKP